jgi:hypothetical protein
MSVIEKVIKVQVKSWLDSENLATPSDINRGLCADFANALSLIVPESIIVGVYDDDDLLYLPGLTSQHFRQATHKGAVGHTAILLGCKFYDAECASGVECFELLPVIQRAMSELLAL